MHVNSLRPSLVSADRAENKRFPCSPKQAGLRRSPRPSHLVCPWRHPLLLPGAVDAQTAGPDVGAPHLVASTTEVTRSS